MYCKDYKRKIKDRQPSTDDIGKDHVLPGEA